jgi:hypothetical protein
MTDEQKPRLRLVSQTSEERVRFEALKKLDREPRRTRMPPPPRFWGDFRLEDNIGAGRVSYTERGLRELGALHASEMTVFGSASEALLKSWRIWEAK